MSDFDMLATAHNVDPEGVLGDLAEHAPAVHRALMVRRILLAQGDLLIQEANRAFLRVLARVIDKELTAKQAYELLQQHTAQLSDVAKSISVKVIP